MQLFPKEQYCWLIQSELRHWRDLPGLLTMVEIGPLGRHDRVGGAAVQSACGCAEGWLTRKGGTLLRSTCWPTWKKASSKIPVHIINSASLFALLFTLEKSLSALQQHWCSSRGCEKVVEA